MVYGAIQFVILSIQKTVQWLGSLSLNIGSNGFSIPVLYFLIALVILGVVIKNIIFKAEV